MRHLLAAAFCLAATSVAAQTVTVRSGAHPGYSRLAFDLPVPRPWQLGRDDAGYVLSLPPGVDLNLSRVWPAIGRNRIAGLRTEGDRLHLSLGCRTCHAIAFETGNGTLVIDVKDGTPPSGSRFEERLALAPLRPRARPDRPDGPALPPVAGYDWTEIPRVPVDVPISPALDPFRDAVLRQLADGAARGVVEMVETPPPRPASGPLPPQMRMGEEPGFIEDPDAPLTAEGRTCIANDQLDLASWGNEMPVAQGFGPARDALEGEFDVPDPDAVERAVRYYLFLGFGAEARQLSAIYPIDAEDRRLFDALGRIMDNEPVTDPLLEPMAGCDGAAALWGILSLPRARVGEPENAGAALQAFVALPQHLRRNLAPQLVERFTQRGDVTSAGIARDAVLRAEPDPDPATRLLVARQAEDDGAKLAAIVSDGGHNADEALIALADRRLTGREPLDEGTLVAIQALLKERTGGEEEAHLRRLVTLGLASLTRFDEAFAELRKAPDAEAELWDWLARTGGEDTLLRHAVLPQSAVPPALPPATRLTLADRLTALGLPDPALRWLPADPVTPPERLSAARAQMARRDAREALRLIAGLDGDDAEAIRTAAEAQLSDPAAPRVIEAQDLLDAAPNTTAGALAQGRALVTDAADARARIEALLNATALQ
ncbi:hypothetical protein [Falsirhodobacter sp. 20TX0035]|uniref:hypothetical protein n=1 Tax=Falsirhodobacter sp. 20TX0035 TaxID=3022019 RepID=UPI00232DEB49|nr:hypothetical protein [Falsirhodobacter sp. 20TX0035]MDB6452476.1 hypothetical protein [Falsirhodobacter sp. 20TX0035]